MRTLALSSLVIAAALLCGAAAAQKSQTGTLVPDRDGTSMVEEAGMPRKFSRPSQNDGVRRKANASANETMRGFTACLVTKDDKREHDALVSFLKTSPEADEVGALARKLIRPDCLFGAGAGYVSLRFSHDLLRGGVFRALYLDTLRSPPRRSLDRREIESVWRDDAKGNFAGMIRYGDCVVASNATAAHTFLMSRVDSAEQIAAVRNLGPALGGCVKPGVTIQLSRMVMEGMLAEALYRRVTAVETAGKAALQ